MAFANIKGVARDPKDYEVYQPEVIIKEVIKEVEVEKIVEVEKKELLQGNLVKDLPKDEKPTPRKKTNKNSWGSPGGNR
jgi:hypothetical protein